MIARLDLDQLRRDHPLAEVIAGSGVKLRAAGGELKGCCPLHADSTPSLSIYDAGRKWICFAGCGGGDVFDYIGKLHGTDLRGAAELLAGGSMPQIELSDKVFNNSPEQASRVDEARAIWDAAVPVGDTLARKYLWHRGLHLTPPPSLRFASLRYGRGGNLLPVLVAAITDQNDELQAVQRIYLRADGCGKAEVPAPKLTLGRLTGGSVRMGPPAGELTLTEGAEDALAVVQATGRVAWATCGTSNLGRVKLPAVVNTVVIGADADDAGRAAAEKAADAYAERWLRVRIAYPPAPAKDWNDHILFGEAA